jgi:hypothetical protein
MKVTFFGFRGALVIYRYLLVSQAWLAQTIYQLRFLCLAFAGRFDAYHLGAQYRLDHLLSLL